MRFGRFIKEARLQRDLTLRRAAARLDISPTYLSQIENGKVPPPSAKVLRKMSDLYGIPLGDLTARAKLRQPEMIADQVEKDRVVAALLRHVLNLSADDRVRALETILKDHCGLSPDQIDEHIHKLKVDLMRLRRGRDGLFAADVRPRQLSRRRIEAFANAVLAEHVAPQNYHPPTNVEILIEASEGISLVLDAELDPDSDGVPEVLGMSHWGTDGATRVIKVNRKFLDDDSDTAEHRERFTMAHELFHALEHLPLMERCVRQKGACLREAAVLNHGIIRERRKLMDSTLEQIPAGPKWWLRQSRRPRTLSTNEDWREWQANTFSSALLMPAWSVRREFTKRFGPHAVRSSTDGRQTAWELAEAGFSAHGVFDPLYKVYSVSRQAMAIRLLALGLVAEG